MKKYLYIISSVWGGVSTHRLRSFLTMLGIVIGVGAVIVLMSIGKGTTQQILSQISNLGANTIFVSPGAVIQGQGGVRTAVGSATSLTLPDAQAIADNIAGIQYIAPSIGSSVQAIVGSQNVRAVVVGVTPEYEQVLSIKMDYGNFISQDDCDSRARVAVIGANVATLLFPDSDPLGQNIRSGNNIVTVVGVMKTSGQSMTGSTDNEIIMPLTTLQILSGQMKNKSGDLVVSSIGVAVTDSKLVKSVAADITTLLMERHQITDPAKVDFRVDSVEALLTSISTITNQLTLLLGAIAAISLLVGGIGVMNIMLVSVLERTREIGIRKALGAKETDIWMQFLLEAAFLTFTGGVIGVILGWGGSSLITRFTTLPTLMTPGVVIMAVSVSVGIGLFFGFYPAWNASRLEPIKALRTE
jgi:putative ABC transport system permease protein